MDKQTIALLLAGGSGSRLGAEIPKQYIDVYGKPIIAYCLETLREHAKIDGIWIVAGEDWRELIGNYAGKKLLGFSKPGETRQLSIWNGLQDLKVWMEKAATQETSEAGKRAVEDSVVLIHDAARPLVSSETISACIDGCAEHDGVMPALPMKDTVYYAVDGRVDKCLERSRVIAGQAPEAFRFGVYYEANRRLMPDEIRKVNGSTEPAVLADLDVITVPGDEWNFKITTAADLKRFLECVESGALRERKHSSAMRN